jgi:hypothetical protein
MKKLLMILALNACAQPSPPEHPSSKTNIPEEPPIPANLTAAIPAPAGLAVPRFDFGAFAIEVASRRVVKIHSRIQLKEQPGAGEVLVESCLPKDPCPALWLRDEVENLDSTPVKLWHSGFWTNHRVLIMNEAGKEAPLTNYGEERKKTFTPRGARDKNAPWSVDPGVLEESDGPINLSALTPLFVEPTQPGKYSLRVDYEEDIAFSSNTLTVFILPGGALSILQKLNQWDKGECDVIERPEAHPNRDAAGESNGYVGTQKEALQKLGVTVRWDAALQTYRVASARLPSP